MPQAHNTTHLTRFLTEVSDALADPTLRFPEPDRSSLGSLIDNGLLPRLARPDMPLNVVFAGPTGAGKSTLINSVAGRPVAQPGVLRPTTTKSLVYTHSSEAPFEAGVPYDRVTGQAVILESMTLIDTPDFDSTNRENRVRALEALSRADVVVFVTSALRYSDLSQWEIVRDMAKRGIPIIFVINRISSATPGVVTDFRRRARDENLSLRVVRVEEHPRVSGAMLPAASVRELRRAIVTAIPLHTRLADRIDRGVSYVESGLRSLREQVRRDQETLLRLREELVGRLLFPVAFDLARHRDRWLEQLNAVSRWSRRSKLATEMESIATDLLSQVGIAVEADLRLVTREGNRLVVDIGDKPTTGDWATEKALDVWFEQVSPRGAVKGLDRRQARAKLSNAIASLTVLLDPPDISPNIEVAEAAAALRKEIDRLYDGALGDLESLNFSPEMAILDHLIGSATVPERIVANA